MFSKMLDVSIVTAALLVISGTLGRTTLASATQQLLNFTLHIPCRCVADFRLDLGPDTVEEISKRKEPQSFLLFLSTCGVSVASFKAVILLLFRDRPRVYNEKLQADQCIEACTITKRGTSSSCVHLPTQFHAEQR